MQRDLYNRELRIQEDEIYRLEECLEECHEVIRGMRKENADLRSQLGGEASGESVLRAEPIEPGRRERSPAGDDDGDRSLLDSGDWSPDRPASPNDAPATASPAFDETPEIVLPAIEGGEPAEAPPFKPPPSSAPIEALPDVEVPAGGPESITPPLIKPPSPIPGPDASELPEAPPFGDARPVAAKLVARCRPGGVEADGAPIMVVTAQSLDQHNRPIEFAGAAGVLLRNPAASPAQRVIAQWDYTADEIAAAWVGGADDRKLVLHVVAPPSAPLNQPLEVWVRLIDAAGEQLLARATIESAPALAESLPAGGGEERGDADIGELESDPPPPLLAELKRGRVVQASAEEAVEPPLPEAADPGAELNAESAISWQALGGSRPGPTPPAPAASGWTRRR